MNLTYDLALTWLGKPSTLVVDRCPPESIIEDYKIIACRSKPSASNQAMLRIDNEMVSYKENSRKNLLDSVRHSNILLLIAGVVSTIALVAGLVFVHLLLTIVAICGLVALLTIWCIRLRRSESIRSNALKRVRLWLDIHAIGEIQPDYGYHPSVHWALRVEFEASCVFNPTISVAEFVRLKQYKQDRCCNKRVCDQSMLATYEYHQQKQSGVVDVSTSAMRHALPEAYATLYYEHKKRLSKCTRDDLIGSVLQEFGAKWGDHLLRRLDDDPQIRHAYDLMLRARNNEAVPQYSYRAKEYALLQDILAKVADLVKREKSATQEAAKREKIGVLNEAQEHAAIHAGFIASTGMFKLE